MAKNIIAPLEIELGLTPAISGTVKIGEAMALLSFEALDNM